MTYARWIAQVLWDLWEEKTAFYCYKAVWFIEVFGLSQIGFGLLLGDAVDPAATCCNMVY